MIHTTAARATTLVALVLSAGCLRGTSDPCAPASIPAGLGCEFWPTVTANAVDGDFAFGVALVNPGGAAASVHLAGGALGAGLDVTVPAGSSLVQTLPWVPALKACSAAGAPCAAATGTSVLATGGAYHLTSTRPIAAWQFSPAPGLAAVGSADATALPGAHALGTSYVAASWPGEGAGTFPGLVAVTAVEDGTALTVTTTAALAAGDLPGVAAGVPTRVTLNRGDVLELLAYAGDLTGTRVVSDKPVQVVGGHFCATVPAGTPYCDHLEEVLPPVPSLGTTYVLRRNLMATKPIVVRVVGIEDGTAISYSRPVAGAPGTLGAGQQAEFELALTDGIVELLATRPVLVAEYLEGQSYAGIDGWGDPSLAIVQPTSRWRTSYELFAPDTAQGGWVDVVAPAGHRVTLDGAPLSPLDSAGGYAIAYAGFAGAVRLASDAPFGVSAYGFGADWSYGYAPAP